MQKTSRQPSSTVHVELYDQSRVCKSICTDHNMIWMSKLSVKQKSMTTVKNQYLRWQRYRYMVVLYANANKTICARHCTIWFDVARLSIVWNTLNHSSRLLNRVRFGVLLELQDSMDTVSQNRSMLTCRQTILLTWVIQGGPWSICPGVVEGRGEPEGVGGSTIRRRFSRMIIILQSRETITSSNTSHWFTHFTRENIHFLFSVRWCIWLGMNDAHKINLN